MAKDIDVVGVGIIEAIQDPFERNLPHLNENMIMNVHQAKSLEKVFPADEVLIQFCYKPDWFVPRRLQTDAVPSRFLYTRDTKILRNMASVDGPWWIHFQILVGVLIELLYLRGCGETGKGGRNLCG